MTAGDEGIDGTEQETPRAGTAGMCATGCGAFQSRQIALADYSLEFWRRTGSLWSSAPTQAIAETAAAAGTPKFGTDPARSPCLRTALTRLTLIR